MTTVEMININDFPDDILTHILFFLPFKHAVRTTILSKRWQPLFHSLAILNIDDEGTNNKNYWYGFRQFMDKNIFPPHSQYITLKSFHLKCNYKLWDATVDSFSLNNWIIAAKQRGIEDLNLLYYKVLLVPTTLFCCKTLVVLQLGYMSVAQMNSCSVDLPSLKTLYLESVSFHDMENLMRLISGCPILENLKTSCVKAKVGVTIGGYLKPLSKLIKADIHLFDFPLKVVCNVQFLSICQMGKIIYNEEIKSYYKSFPVFGNLTNLQLYWWHEEILDWDDVVKILQNCSKLQTLKTQKCGNSTSKEDWKYPDHIPKCVSSHLTTCKIEGYDALYADFRLSTVNLWRSMMYEKKIRCSQFVQSYIINRRRRVVSCRLRRGFVFGTWKFLLSYRAANVTLLNSNIFEHRQHNEFGGVSIQEFVVASSKMTETSVPPKHGSSAEASRLEGSFV
ncbi:hypothetical protein TSUD_357290 [Trifolium subterraneum]|uniref:F-box domain-containing protein n=1 Tax=Trifolium subterraneum TaxID=3900 RepID=A0A2Z6NCB8_TRISU|nr:hypothetical protein TSUD_357290 [Trifolium subterraneum]